MEVNYGGFLGHSLVDWPGRSACVVFLRGCILKCPRCINEHLQNGSSKVPIEDIFKQIDKVSKTLSAVMISGGECLLQPEAVMEIADYAHRKNLDVGIETSGCTCRNLKKVLPGIEFVLMSIKSDFHQLSYAQAAGVGNGQLMSNNVLASLDALYGWGWDGEICLATPVFKDNLYQLPAIYKKLNQYVSRDTPWRLIQGLYPDKSQEPITIDEISTQAKLLQRDGHSHVKVVV